MNQLMSDAIFVQKIIDVLNVYKNEQDFTNIKNDLISGCKDASSVYVRNWINIEDSNYESKFQEVGFRLDNTCREIYAWYLDFSDAENKNSYILETIQALEEVQ